jgi:hypothetical protein
MRGAEIGLPPELTTKPRLPPELTTELRLPPEVIFLAEENETNPREVIKGWLELTEKTRAGRGEFVRKWCGLAGDKDEHREIVRCEAGIKR